MLEDCDICPTYEYARIAGGPAIMYLIEVHRCWMFPDVLSFRNDVCHLIYQKVMCDIDAFVIKKTKTYTTPPLVNHGLV